MATWPSGTKASTTHLDAGTDSPRLARADIKQNVDNVNSIIDMFNIDSPTNNQLLIYNTSNSRFELGTSSVSPITFVGDDSTGTAVNTGETFKIAGGTGITTAVSGDTVTITNSGVLSDTTPQLGGDLDLNSNNITGTGSISITGDIANDAVSIADNKITTTRSNDSLLIEANGTGNIVIGSYTDTSQFGLSRPNGPLMVYEDLAFDGSDRSYSNQRISTYRYAADVTNDSNGRTRISDSIFVDFNGYDNDSNASSSGTGPQITHLTEIRNTASSGTAVVGNIHGQNSGVYFSQSGGVGSTLDCEDVYNYRSFGQVFASSGDTIDINDHYHYSASGWLTGGNQATFGVTNEYGYYVGNNFQGTNQYAFYNDNSSADYLLFTTTDTAKSRVGTLERYRESINSLTSSSTITVDCSLAPVHTVTLGTNTGFVVSNLGTGQSTTIIITQDGTGSRTATFGTDGSTAVKFPGGAPTLTTTAAGIDVITIFNDGTNYLGNIAQAYA